MDGVKQISMVEHIRKRVGMYWQTHDGIPDESVWICFLDQLANEMGRHSCAVMRRIDRRRHRLSLT